MLSLTSIALLVAVLISSNIGLTGLSREGPGYWLIHLAPISPWPVLWAKMALTFLPFPVVGTLFTGLVGLLRQPPLGDLFQAWAIVALTGVGVSGIVTGAGAAYPRFDWVQAQRMTTLRAGCIAPVIYYTYTGMMLFLTLGAGRMTRRVPTGLSTLIPLVGWSVAGLLTLVALFVPLGLAAARMRRLEL